MRGVSQTLIPALKRQGPAILTCVGSIGVVVTAALSAKKTPKAMRVLEEAKKKKGEDLTKQEIVKTAGPVYIPAILTGAATIACIVGAHKLNRKQLAALASAYALLDRSYKEYKGKIDEVLGEGTNDQIQEEIAKDKYKETDISVENGLELFYDEFSKRYFKATAVTVQYAEYSINRDIHLQGWATLNDFYKYMKVPPIDGGDELGWSEGMNYDYYWQSWVDVGHSRFKLDDGTECCRIVLYQEPNLGFDEY